MGRGGRRSGMSGEDGGRGGWRGRRAGASMEEEGEE
jgi:hypothetical protein